MPKLQKPRGDAGDSSSLVAFYDVPAQPAAQVMDVEIDAVEPNPNQPRRDFDAKRLRELARSIRETGIIQPIVVMPRGQRLVIICGERRWQAAGLAGLRRIPVVVREADDEQALVLGLIENIQREALNPLDEALAIQSLIEDFRLTHADIARRVSRSRSHVTNLLRLLNLPHPVQEMIRAGQLKPGHARGVLRLRQPEAQLRLARRIVSESLSVRRVERATPAKKVGVSRETISPPAAPGAAPLGPRLSPARRAPAAKSFLTREVQHLTRAIETRLGKDLGIFWNGVGGQLTIPFESQDQLADLLSSLLRS